MTTEKPHNITIKVKPPQIGVLQLFVLVEELARGHSNHHSAHKSREVCLDHGLSALSPSTVIKHWLAPAQAQAAAVQKTRDEAYRREIARRVAVERGWLAAGGPS